MPRRLSQIPGEAWAETPVLAANPRLSPSPPHRPRKRAWPPELDALRLLGCEAFGGSASFSHTPTRRSTFTSSHAANCAASRNAITPASSTAGFLARLTPIGGRRLVCSSAVVQDFEVVAVEPDAQHVAERINDRGGDEPRAPLGHSLELSSPQRHQPLGAWPPRHRRASRRQPRLIRPARSGGANRRSMMPSSCS